MIQRRLKSVEHQISGDVESAFLVFDDGDVLEAAALWTEKPPRLVVRSPDQNDVREPRTTTEPVNAVVTNLTEVRGRDGAVLALCIALAGEDNLWLYWRGGDFVDVARGARPDLAD